MKRQSAFTQAKIKYTDLIESYGTHKQLYYEAGHAGLGVIFNDFGGDGVFPVYAHYNKDGDCVRLVVEFPQEDQTGVYTEELGEVGVDSGQLLITDPCYILE